MTRVLGFALVLLALVQAATPARAETPAPDTLRRIVPMPPIEVSTSRLGDRAPVAHSSLGRADLQRVGWGQDTPMALGRLPGAYAYSDAGNGIGYSYLSVRGFPQRRISVLVNGVPLNDPETHEVWWIDHPDLLASTSELQLQRGVGSSLYGAAALGASVSLVTGPVGEDRAFSAEVTGGSYGTRRLMLEGGSGPLAGGWSLYGRYSRVQTDGYRERSWSKLWSYALSARRASERQSWTLNLYGGPENTHLSYVGIPYENRNDRLVSLEPDRGRRWNPIAYAGEQDHYFEPHYELLHSWSPRDRLALSQTFFWFDGSGYYDEQRLGSSLADYRLAPWATYDTLQFAKDWYDTTAAGTFVRDAQGRALVVRADLVRHREVTNRHFGWVPRARLEHARGAFTLGGELRAHDGHHVGAVISGSGLPPGTPPDMPYYDYHPRTLSAGVFGREEWDATASLRVIADLAWRHQGYDMRDDRFDGVRFRQDYDFVLPRLGVDWSATRTLSAFASVAYASREPALRDLYEGERAGAAALFRNGKPLVRPERVTDVELGGRWRAESASASLNLFHMNFRDELVGAGQYDTDLNEAIVGNAARSVHQGVELEGAIAWGAGAARLHLDANATLSDNHFVLFTEHWGPTPDWDANYDGKAIGFFPAIMANVGARAVWRGLEVGAAARMTGRIYVDHSETMALSIPPHTVLDLSFAAGRRVGAQHVQATLRVLNAADLRYATGGWVDYDPTTPDNWVPWLTPAATRNWLAGLRVEW